MRAMHVRRAFGSSIHEGNRCVQESGEGVLILPVLEDSSKSELFSSVNRTVGNFLMMVKREGRVWLVGLRSALREEGEKYRACCREGSSAW